MSLKKYCKKKYLEFAKYEGSQHIASEFAIYKLTQIVEKFNRKSILEIGLGIGSISSTILDGFNREINYIGTEANKFCLDSLPKNLSKTAYESLTIIDSLEKINERQDIYDYVIIDGLYENIIKLKSHLSADAIIAIEGDRTNQEGDIKSIFPKAKGVHLISSKKNSIGGISNPKDWQGGMKIYFISPNMNQLTYWYAQKIRTKIIYLKRKFL